MDSQLTFIGIVFSLLLIAFLCIVYELIGSSWKVFNILAPLKNQLEDYAIQCLEAYPSNSTLGISLSLRKYLKWVIGIGMLLMLIFGKMLVFESIYASLPCMLFLFCLLNVGEIKTSADKKSLRRDPAIKYIVFITLILMVLFSGGYLIVYFQDQLTPEQRLDNKFVEFLYTINLTLVLYSFSVPLFVFLCIIVIFSFFNTFGLFHYIVLSVCYWCLKLGRSVKPECPLTGTVQFFKLVSVVAIALLLTSIMFL